MTRQIVFQIHWFLGITAGLVLAVMGVTGATISFENEISEALAPRVYAPGAPVAADLSPDTLIARVEAAHPGFYISRLDWETNRERSHGVRLNAIDGRGREQGRVDRATGAWLGEGGGSAFFGLVEDLHRWLALPGGGNGIGRQLTGFSAIALIFFALSGLYLRWPRQALDWRSWLVLDLRKTGRNLWRALHVVIGTWVLIFYLLSGMTGLWWSYDWYRRGVTYALTGKAAGGEGGRRDEKRKAEFPRRPIDPSWAAFMRDRPGAYEWIRITQPRPGEETKAISFDARPAGARHARQTDRYSFDPATGSLKDVDTYDRRPLGQVVTQSMFELHRGAFFGLPGRIVMLLTSLTMPLFAITGYMLYLSRRRRKRKGAATQAPEETAGSGRFIIAYASQTGSAERRARNAATAFSLGGEPTRLLPLSRLTPDALVAAQRVLVVASTYGEGDPPDTARAFARKVMAEPIDLSHLDYGVLALGDREYPDFCAFGERVEGWFQASGATALFPMIAMDGDSAGAEESWTTELRRLGAAEGSRGQQVPATTPWLLSAREALNAGSAHAGAWHIRLEPSGTELPEWQAGDIVEVHPCNDPARVAALIAAAGLDGAAMIEGQSIEQRLSHAILPTDPALLRGTYAVTALRPLPMREYSIASIPADGTLDLFVRLTTAADGRLGIGSGWLTTLAPVGGPIALRMRPNGGFRVEDGAGPLILIGNGTGIAGLRAHLKAQAHDGRGGHWLLFGERTRAHDAFFDTELQAWLADGTLARLDRAFSRDADCGRYVQHLVESAADDIVEMIANGAVILVCGSLEGMAPAVDAVLRRAMGDDGVDSLIENGQYKRDVY